MSENEKLKIISIKSHSFYIISINSMKVNNRFSPRRKYRVALCPSCGGGEAQATSYCNNIVVGGNLWKYKDSLYDDKNIYKKRKKNEDGRDDLVGQRSRRNLN